PLASPPGEEHHASETWPGPAFLESPGEGVAGVAEYSRALFRRRAEPVSFLQGLAPLLALYRLAQYIPVSYIARIVLALAAILPSTSGRCWPGEASRDEALSLLRACLRTQSKMHRVSLQVATDLHLPGSAANGLDRQRAESYIRRDGDRLDVSQRYLILAPKGGQERAHRWRAVTTREAGVLYFAGVSRGPPSRGTVTKDWATWFTR